MAELVLAIQAIYGSLQIGGRERDAPADAAQGSAEAIPSAGSSSPPAAQVIQASANKRKQMKINVSKIAFFYLRLFFRIGTFQWVTGDSNKKIRPVLGSAFDVSSQHLSCLSAVASLRGADSIRD
jgi:hypothetical protein